MDGAAALPPLESAHGEPSGDRQRTRSDQQPLRVGGELTHLRLGAGAGAAVTGAITSAFNSVLLTFQGKGPEAMGQADAARARYARGVEVAQAAGDDHAMSELQAALTAVSGED